MPMQDRFQHLFAVISGQRFLNKQGLGNEVPFFICPYKPDESVEMERLKRQLVNRLEQAGVRILSINLYDLSIAILRKRDIWNQKYWLFSSPKGSFNALIHMQRYRPDTVGVGLNDYLREFRTKLTSHKNHLDVVSIIASSSLGKKTKALTEIAKTTKMTAEMDEYEREVLYPLATEQVKIDPDDGVKVSYPKLGAGLKKIIGLEAEEDE
ncbi:MAG: BREX-1 system adenine-specific DNA-methyltransferase PglX [Verrucomicrobia bacterium]|nr:BREX-1 system adenine-specific DNA-methyltransferase PglX [Verrucomicrobiota bacterium]